MTLWIVADFLRAIKVYLILTEFFSNNCSNFSILSRHFESSISPFCATWNWRDDQEARKFDAVAIFSNEICKWRWPVKNHRLPTILNLEQALHGALFALPSESLNRELARRLNSTKHSCHLSISPIPRRLDYQPLFGK